MAQPGPEGNQFRVEVYDMNGERVLLLACPLGANPATFSAWEEVLACLE